MVEKRHQLQPCQRIAAKNDFEKDFFKLMNNAVFRKSFLFFGLFRSFKNINDFHYNYIKQKYPDSTLLFTNTDFLRYQIKMVNMYEDFYAEKKLFNFSGYEKECPFYNDENKKVIGKMKDELNGEVIEKMVRLRAKFIH